MNTFLAELQPAIETLQLDHHDVERKPGKVQAFELSPNQVHPVWTMLKVFQFTHSILAIISIDCIEPPVECVVLIIAFFTW